ncbi:MAG: sigma-54-dependent Fis family transcriptional regulator [Rhodothermales bacterium]|nr:sigma-54-dependent Fis family transcriptional regulator [Rhodothermales bacterium]
MSIVLVVDDMRPMAEQYAYDLRRVGGFQTLIANGGAEAIETLASEPIDCVLLDLEMPGVDGFEVLRSLRKSDNPVPVIVYTGAGSYDRCVRAVNLGAYSFIDKAEPVPRVAQEVANAIEHATLRSEVRALQKNLSDGSSLVGDSQAMTDLRSRIARVSPIPSAVLIVGDSGTGKELVAREIHRIWQAAANSEAPAKNPRRPFVALNCAALPGELIESELFGHERGAFTGASQTRKGAFEMASGGTLFLDEVGEMPLMAQAKLLRVLEQRTIMRIGGSREITVDARVIAATNRNLDEEVAGGRFREDLLFRLNVHQLRVPPLAERRSDIPELAHHFLATICARFGMKTKSLSAEALKELIAYDWHRNNVRELRNIIERMIIATDDETIAAQDVPVEVYSGASDTTGQSSADRPQSFRQLRLEAERQILVQALERNGWHISKTAVELGLSDHSSLLKIMRRHNLKKP